MKTLDDFCKKNNPKKRVSNLHKFKDEILDLYDKNYQVEQIQEYLKHKKINISTSAIYKFIQKNTQGEQATKNFSLKNLKKQKVVSKVETEDQQEQETVSFQNLKEILQGDSKWYT